MPSPIVFIDFAGPDDGVLRDFYATVFDWQADAGGTFSAPASASLECAIRKDPAGNPMGLVEMDGDRPRIP